MKPVRIMGAIARNLAAVVEALSNFLRRVIRGTPVLKAVVVAIATTLTGLWLWYHRGNIVQPAPAKFLETPPTADAPVAPTDAGRVLGYRHAAKILRFSRIPYAAPPLGKLRFYPPQPLVPWSGILDTRNPGPICIQRFTPVNQRYRWGHSEDCLSLTVTTPGLDRAKRPVIVWLHGGGLANGGNHDPTYDSAHFVTRGDVVFVNLQYRLGALGWLDISPLGEEEVNESQRHGQLDVVAGLDWVQRNIEQFGGDPNNVTLMGQSAGSYIIASLLLLPEAQPLFHRAILQSGVYDVWEIPADRGELLRRVLDRANVSTLEELRRLSPQQLQKIEQEIYQFGRSKGWPDPMPWYNFRGITATAFAAAARQGKPILQGTLSHEFDLFLSLYGKDDPYEQIVKGFLKSLGLTDAHMDRLVAKMRPWFPDTGRQQMLVELAGAIYMHYPHALLAESYGAAPVYSYLIDWDAPNFPEIGAFHALDLPLVFGNFETWGWALGETPPETLSNQMQAAWIAFAKTGDPNHGELPHWPRYSQKNRATMVFGETSKVGDDPMGWVRELGAMMDEMVGGGN